MDRKKEAVGASESRTLERRVRVGSSSREGDENVDGRQSATRNWNQDGEGGEGGGACISRHTRSKVS